jgi:hypothetical protein
MYNKNKAIFYSLLIALSGMSCGKENKPNIPSLFGFDEYNVIVSEIVIEEQLHNPISVFAHNDTLFVTDESNQPSVAVYQLNGSGVYTRIKEIGREGSGPGEFAYPYMMTPNNSGLYVYDARQRKLALINKQLETDIRELYLRFTGLPVDVHAVSDSLFLATGVHMDSRVQLLGVDGSDLFELEGYGEIADLGDSFTEMRSQVASVWHARSTYSREQSRIAVFSVNADRIELYDTSSGQLITTLSHPENEVPNVRISSSSGNLSFNDDALRSYLWVTSDRQYIYALYSGVEQHANDSGYGRYVHVFDWDLNFITAFELDHGSRSITSDLNGGIYSVEHDPRVAIRHVTIPL